MKINKLIPIVSMAATSIVAPIAITSCHPNYVEPMEMHNLLEPYETKSQQHGLGEKNQTEATMVYIERVNENPNIFYDDVCQAVQKLKDIQLETDWSLTKFSFGVSRPQFGETIVSRYGSNDIPYSTITVEQRIQIQYVLPANGSIKTIWDVDFDVWYKDVVFYAYENENTLPEQSKWNLGLFDYNIGEEAFWPFVSNLNPWSISYSCESVQTRYYIEEGQPNVLLDHKASYFSAMLDNGSKLLNLITYYNEHSEPPAGDDPLEWFIEHTAIEVMLIDYESWYLAKVKNSPEIRLTHILQSNYSKTNPSKSLSLDGLILILPTSITDPSEMELTVSTREPIVYKVSHYDEPMFQENEISIADETPISISGKITDYRYKLSINEVKLKEFWTIDPSLPDEIDLLMAGKAASINVRMELGSKTWGQKIMLPYNYCIQHIS